MAAAAFLALVLMRLGNVGFFLAGYTAEFNVAAAIRTLVNTAIIVVGAGYGNALAAAGWVAATWVPVHAFLLMQGWLHWTWLSSLLMIPVGMLWLNIYLILAANVAALGTRLLGENGALDDLLTDMLPFGPEQPERTDGM